MTSVETSMKDKENEDENEENKTRSGKSSGKAASMVMRIEALVSLLLIHHKPALVLLVLVNVLLFHFDKLFFNIILLVLFIFG